jgi:prophage regulatory protein
MAKNVLSTRKVILRLRQVSARTGPARSTIYERIKTGEVPARIALGARAVGWLDANIDAWISVQGERSRVKSVKLIKAPSTRL